MSGNRLLRLEGRQPPNVLLASAEYILGLSLSTGRSFTVVGSVAGESLVLGLYTAVPSEAGAYNVYRRLTGGAPALLDPGDQYLAATFKSRGLRDAAQLASRLAECLDSAAWGVTLVEGWGLVEALAYTGDPRACLGVLDAELEAESRLPASALAGKAKLYLQPSWRLYKVPEGEAGLLSFTVYRGRYWLRIILEPYEEYIADAWLTGVFNAAPPMEPYSLLATVRGVRIDDIVIGNIEVAAQHRLELYGVSGEDFIALLRAAGEKLGTLSGGRD